MAASKIGTVGNTARLYSSMYAITGFNGKDFIVVDINSTEAFWIDDKKIRNMASYITNIDLKYGYPYNWDMGIIGTSKEELGTFYIKDNDKFGGILTILKEYKDMYTNQVYGYLVADSCGNVKKLSISDVLKASQLWKITNGRVDDHRIYPVRKSGFMYELVEYDSKTKNSLYSRGLSIEEIKRNIRDFKNKKEVCRIKTKDIKLYCLDSKCTRAVLRISSVKCKDTDGVNNLKYRISVSCYDAMSDYKPDRKYSRLLSCNDFYIISIITGSSGLSLKVLYKDKETEGTSGEIKEVWEYSCIEVNLLRDGRVFKNVHSEGQIYCNNMIYTGLYSISACDVASLTEDELNIKIAALRNRCNAIRIREMNKKDGIKANEIYNKLIKEPRGRLSMVADIGGEVDGIALIVESEGNSLLYIDTVSSEISTSLIDIIANYYSIALNKGNYGLVDAADISIVRYLDSRLGLKQIEFNHGEIIELSLNEALHNNGIYTKFMDLCNSNVKVYKSDIMYLMSKYDDKNLLISSNFGMERYEIRQNKNNSSTSFVEEYKGKLVANVPLYDWLGNRVDKDRLCYIAGSIDNINLRTQKCDSVQLLEIDGYDIDDVVIGKGMTYLGYNNKTLCKHNTVLRFGLEAYARERNMRLCARAQLEDTTLLEYIVCKDINRDTNIMTLYTVNFKIEYNIDMLAKYLHTVNKVNLYSSKNLMNYKAKISLIGIQGIKVDDFGYIRGNGRINSVSTENGIIGVVVDVYEASRGYGNDTIQGIEIDRLYISSEFKYIDTRNHVYGDKVKLRINNLVVHGEGCKYAVSLIKLKSKIKIDTIVLDDTVTAALFKAILAKDGLNIKGCIDIKTYKRLKGLKIEEWQKDCADIILKQLYRN